MVLYSSGHPHVTGPGPRHRAQLSEVMSEAWAGALFPKEFPTAFWDRMIWRRRHGLTSLHMCDPTFLLQSSAASRSPGKIPDL